MYGCEGGFFFTVKAMFKRFPIRTVVSIIFTSVIFSGLSLFIAERPITRIIDPSELMKFDTLTNSCWCALISMCTVGYGDMYPMTHFG